MRRLPPRLVVVSGLLVLGVAVGQATTTAPALPDLSAAELTAAVQGASAVCPDLQQTGGQSTRVAVGLAPDPAEESPAPNPPDATTVQRLVVGDGEPAELPLTGPGQAVTDLGATVGEAAYAVSARGPAAGGLTAVATTESAAGLASTPCLPARTDSWLLGGGAAVGDTAVLVLANPDPVEAAVDLTVLSAEGGSDGRAGRGLQVPAGGRLLVPLDELAPGRSVLAVRVQTSRGRVAAALRHTRVSGAIARGLDLAAVSGGPASELVVPGLPAGPGGRAVLLANPGDVDVVTRLELTTGAGQFVPEGVAALTVPARSTVLADLSEPLAATPAAVRVSSTGGPVLAAGVAEDAGAGEGGEVRDFTYVAAVPPLTRPALLPDLPVDGVTTTTLLLSAVSSDAVVDVELLGVVGGPDVPAATRRVEVPGGRTVALVLPSLLAPDFRGRVVVVLRPAGVGAPVHASLVRSARPVAGPRLAVVGLRGGLPPAAQPAVVRDPAVGAG